MIRQAFYLTQSQKSTLESFDDLNVSEHIRRAIDEYIDKRKQRHSQSPSKTVKL